MKRFILGMLLSAFVSVSAAETVKVFWPFAPASQQAIMIRSLIDQANSQQNRYQFVFVHRPGAGGSIASNAALTETGISVLASTSSFYIRPLLYKDSHDVEKFNMLSAVCLGQPLAIYSKNKTLLADAKTKNITIGVIPGSITALVGRTIKLSNPDINITEIPFKGTPEATTNMLGGHIDGSVDFLGKPTITSMGEGTHVIGITGSENHPGFKTFTSSGIKGLGGLVNDYYIFIDKNASVRVQNEIREILTVAAVNKVKTHCEDDFGYTMKLTAKEITALNDSNKSKWKALTANIEKE